MATNEKSSEGRWFGWSTIYGVDGEHRTPYMTRVWIGRLRLHIFHRGDADPDPHDHPWDFWTFPLTSYAEEVTIPAFLTNIEGDSKIIAARTEQRIVEAWRWHYRPATHLHRVTGRVGRNLFDDKHWVPIEGKIVTIVWRGKSSRPWGFLKNRDGKWCWIGWREYIFNGGKSAPCE